MWGPTTILGDLIIWGLVIASLRGDRLEADRATARNDLSGPTTRLGDQMEVGLLTSSSRVLWQRGMRDLLGSISQQSTACLNIWKAASPWDLDLDVFKYSNPPISTASKYQLAIRAVQGYPVVADDWTDELLASWERIQGFSL